MGTEFSEMLVHRFRWQGAMQDKIRKMMYLLSQFQIFLENTIQREHTEKHLLFHHSGKVTRFS